MDNLDKKRQSKRFRKMISSDNTLLQKYRDKIFDAINKLCNYYPNRFKLRLLIHEIEIILRNPEHIQAKRGFVGLIKIYGKRNDVVDIFKHISNSQNVINSSNS